jgi:chromosome partitioning protein
MNSIAFFSLKGGTGKTTLSCSIGWALAEQGHNVLLIDMDPQGHLTQFFRGKPTKGQTKLYYSLIHKQPLLEAVVPTTHPRLSLIPATEDHFYLHTALFSTPWREWRLKDALNSMHPFPYDLVIIDLGANLTLLTYVALFAAKILVVPVLPDLFSYLSLKSLFAFLDKTCKNYKYNFDMIWILMNKLNNHRLFDRENRDALKKYYGKFLMPVMIREDSKFSQATRDQVPITSFAPQSIATRDIKKVAEFLETVIFKPKSDNPL